MMFAAELAAAPDGAWVSTAAIGAICTGLGAILARFFPQKTRVEPDPIHTEQSQSQVAFKDNARDHENIFARLGALEKDVAAQGATLKAQTEYMKEELREMKEMVKQLFDRICGGKKK